MYHNHLTTATAFVHGPERQMRLKLNEEEEKQSLKLALRQPMDM